MGSGTAAPHFFSVHVTLSLSKRCVTLSLSKRCVTLSFSKRCVTLSLSKRELVEA
jgi:hypothetical protein